MDEFNFFQFFNDDDEILQAEDQHSRDFPTFRVHFGEYFDDFLPSQAQNSREPESTKSATNEENQKPPQKLDISRFPVISSDEIHGLKSVASNKNTSPPQNNGWMFSEAGVNVAILNMSPSKQWRLKNLTRS